MKIIEHYKSLSLLNKFVVNTICVGLFWYLFFYIVRRLVFIDPLYDEFSGWLTHILLEISQFFLSLVGEQSLIYGKALQQIGGNGIYLDKGCLGRNLMGLFAGFIVVFPGRINTKLWFIPMGLIIIFIINILRIVGLYLTNKYLPQYMNINHHMVFKYTVYACTFLLWYIWIKKFRKKKAVEVKE